MHWTAIPIRIIQVEYPQEGLEGYLEAFATIYTEVATAIMARRTASLADPGLTLPTIEGGFAGVTMVDAVLRTSGAGGVWMPVES